MLELGLLPVNLLAKLGSPRLILHNLRIHVRVADLILMLLVHLLLSVLPLLGGGISRLIRRNIATNLVVSETLLVRHLLLVIHCVVLGGATKVTLAVLLASKVALLVSMLVCVALGTCDTWLPSVLRS